MSEPPASPSRVGNEVGPQCPPLFSRPTPRAPRPTLAGILPVTNGRFVKEQTGPDLDERSLYIQYVTEPGNLFGQINLFLPARRPSVDHSLVVGGARRQGPQSCLHDG